MSGVVAAESGVVVSGVVAAAEPSVPVVVAGVSSGCAAVTVTVLVLELSVARPMTIPASTRKMATRTASPSAAWRRPRSGGVGAGGR